MITKNQPTRSFANTIAFALFTILLLSSSNVSAQIRGLIIQPATSSGQAVLDPNRDGYVSSTRNGFSSNDIAESEIQYKAIPQLSQDPDSDLGPGPDCGFTDFVDLPSEQAISTFVDANNNLLFRFRLGGASPNSKGYSILIDTDQRFGNTGVNADPNYTSVNPGFEIEIVLRTNFGVDLNDVDGRSTPLTRTTLSYNGYHQKAVAHSLNCGDYDYFYDFYIPLSTITSHFPGFSLSTPIRMVGTTVIAPKSALEGPISDLGGVDDNAYANNSVRAWTALINNFVPTTLNTIKTGGSFSADRSDAPVITSSLTASSTTINGTSTEATGTTIRIFRNGVQIGTTTVSNTNTFSLTGVTLAQGDVITATAQATNESVSLSSAEVVVGGTSCSAPPTLSCSSQKGFVITAPAGSPEGTIIRVYRLSALGPQLISSGPTVIYTSGNTSTNAYTYKCNNNSIQPGNCNNGNNCVVAGTYFFTAQEQGRCESFPSTFFNSQCTPGTTPVITTSTTTALTGTTNVAGQTILVRINDVYYGSTVSSLSPTTTGGSTYTYSYTGFSATAGQTVSVRGIVSGGCATGAATATITGVAAAPVITTTSISTNTTTISGTSTEADGSVITIYRNGNAIGTATVFGGVFNLNAPSSGFGFSAADIITARVTTATNKTISPASNSITVAATTSRIPTITGPVYENATTISGTSTSPYGTVIRLYLDGDLIGQTTVGSGGNFTVSNLNPAYELYPGGRLTATATETGLAEGSQSTAVVIQCVTPLSNQNVTATNACQNNTATVTIFNPEDDVMYRLKSGSTYYSAYAVALAGASSLTITTDVLPNVTTLTLTVEAMKIPPATCSTNLVNTVTVNVYGLPANNLTVTAANLTICSGSSTTISVDNTTSGFSYQLRIGTTNVGNAITSNGGTIILPTGNLTANTTYNIIARNGTTGCDRVLTTTPTITVNAQEKNVAAVNSTVCSGSSTNIQVLNSESGATYQLRNGTTNIGSAVTSTSNGSTISLPTGTINATTSFNVVATRSGCTTNLASQATVTVGNPASRTIEASATAICNGSSVNISVLNSEAGVSYQLRIVSGSTRTNVGSAVSGSGSTVTPLILASVSPGSTTTYDVLATRTAGTCTTVISGPTVTVNIQPADRTVTGPTAVICNGASANITIASESGVSYQLRSGTTNIGNPVNGTGSNITLATGALSTTTTFNILATANTGSCSTTLTTRPKVIVNGQKNVAATISTLCSGASTFITVDNTEVGVTYDLLNGSTVVGTIEGDGGMISFPTGAINNTTTYTVRGISSSTCTTTMSMQPTVTVSNPAGGLTVNAPSNVCSGSSANITVTGSETGVAYQLYTSGGTAVGTPVNGNGSSSLSIVLPTGPLTTATTFRIVATRLSGGCTTTLTTQPSVGINPQPASRTVTGPSAAVCSGSAGTVTVSNAEAGVTYVLRNGTTMVDSRSASSGSTITLNTGNLTTATTFNVIATTTSCTTALGDITVPVTATQKNVFAEAAAVCTGGSTNILVELSEQGVNYQLRTGTTNIGNAVAGNNSTISLPTGTINSTTTYNVLAYRASPTCTTNLSITPTVTVATPTTNNTVTAPSNACNGESVNITISNSQNGVFYQLRKGTTNIGNALEGNGTTLTLNTGSITADATYNILATNTSAGCSAQLNTTPFIEADCEAAYSPGSKTYATGYSFDYDETIATVTDADGFDASNTSTAVLISGTLPAGIGLDGLTGRLYVINPNDVVASSATLGIRTTDVNGKRTDHSFVLVINTPGPPLPVDFISLRGKLVENRVELSWVTAWEVNNDFFIVERSTDGIKYNAIGTKKGAGNSSVLMNYSFTDNSPVKGVSYYRIKQIDFNGEFDYSKTIVIRNYNSSQHTVTMSFFPNPVADNKIYINFKGHNHGNVARLYVTDILGKNIIETQVAPGENVGVQLYDRNGQRLKPGVYTIQLVLDRIVYIDKLIIK